MAQRRANLFNSGETEMPDDGRFGGVGALLRRRREEIQQDVEDVSRQLRIRSAYIRAIEEGKFQELPGNAYAIGFVRAYADYLGLDGNNVVSDYRDELARRSRQNDLVWPTEGGESRFPGGAILGVCLLLAVAIYGGWYYASQSGGTGIKLIDQVPDYIKKQTGFGESAENEPPAEPTRTEAQAATSTAEPAAPSPAPAPAATETAPAAESAPSTQTAAAPTPPAPAVVATPTPSNAPAAVALGQGQPEPAPAAPATPTPTAPASSEPASEPSGTAAVSPAPAATEQASTTTEPATVPPAAKVVIRANRDSWIEIRDKDDAVVLQRVLRQGETFSVPDQKGMVMTTGNAGGIVIELEGRPLQALGSLGVVKRGIRLDPTALSDGSAFNTEE
ncbi:helix-turn-helix domain-containing protein [Dongia sp.]|uniref:helix-turn-helix domain-containing protein n=1 Tax=Dongia sp. TaxID=1977262 RepID=UPI003751DC88